MMMMMMYEESGLKTFYSRFPHLRATFRIGYSRAHLMPRPFVTCKRMLGVPVSRVYETPELTEAQMPLWLARAAKDFTRIPLRLFLKDNTV